MSELETSFDIVGLCIYEFGPISDSCWSMFLGVMHAHTYTRPYTHTPTRTDIDLQAYICQLHPPVLTEGSSGLGKQEISIALKKKYYNWNSIICSYVAQNEHSSLAKNLNVINCKPFEPKCFLYSVGVVHMLPTVCILYVIALSSLVLTSFHTANLCVSPYLVGLLVQPQYACLTGLQEYSNFKFLVLYTTNVICTQGTRL